MENIGYIYGLKCPIREEIVYIGQTINKLSIRLNGHIGRVKTKIKYNRILNKKDCWIKKLILLNKEKEIEILLIEECSIDKLDDMEIFYISEYSKNTNMKNTAIGGRTNRGYRHSEESISKIKSGRVGKNSGSEHHNFGKKIGNESWFKLTDLMKSDKNPNIGKECKKETRDKISIANAGENNGMYGKRFKKTDEQVERLSSSLKNSAKLKESRNSKEYKEKLSNHFSIPILVLDMKFNIVSEFKNCRLCAEHFGFKKSNIANAIRFYRKIGKGRTDKFWVVKKEDYEGSVIKIKELLIL